MTKTKLLKDEKIIAKATPHPLSFTNSYLMFLYPILVALGVYALGTDHFSSWLRISSYETAFVVSISVLWLMLLAPAVALGFLGTSKKPLMIYILLATMCTIIRLYINPPLPNTYIILAAMGAFGLILTNMHRRSHKYWITNLRIIFEHSFLSTSRRDLTYDMIVDLTLQQEPLGRVFDFATILPLTASTLGIGSDSAIITGSLERKTKRLNVGVSVGREKGTNIPRTKTYYSLHGIPRPHKLYGLIIKLKMQNSEIRYLKNIADDVKTLRRFNCDWQK